MKKLLVILAAAAAISTTGCSNDLEFGGGSAGYIHSLTIDDIYVEPKDWKRALLDNGWFDYLYCDITLPEITRRVFDGGTFTTYWRWDDLIGPDVIKRQEQLPSVMVLDRYEDNQLKTYTEYISCSYEVGYMRIMISRDDFYDGLPQKTLYFRTVLQWNPR